MARISKILGVGGNLQLAEVRHLPLQLKHLIFTSLFAALATLPIGYENITFGLSVGLCSTEDAGLTSFLFKRSFFMGPRYP